MSRRCGYSKLHHSMWDNPRLQEMDAVVIWTWLFSHANRERATVDLSASASVAVKRGQLLVSVVSLARRWGISHKRLRSILESFEAEGMITKGKSRGNSEGKSVGNSPSLITICNYEFYQGSSASEGKSEGKNKGKNKGNGLEEERKNPPYNPPAGGMLGDVRPADPVPLFPDAEPVPPEPEPRLAPGEVPPPRKAPSRGSRVPDDFRADEAGVKLAKSLGMTREQYLPELERFKDYWRALPGQRGLKLDWQATWRNWVKSWAERRPQNRFPNGSPPNPPNGGGRPRDPDAALWGKAKAEAEAQGVRTYDREGLAEVQKIFERMKEAQNGQENAHDRHTVYAA